MVYYNGEHRAFENRGGQTHEHLRRLLTSGDAAVEKAKSYWLSEAGLAKTLEYFSQMWAKPLSYMPEVFHEGASYKHTTSNGKDVYWFDAVRKLFSTLKATSRSTVSYRTI